MPLDREVNGLALGEGWSFDKADTVKPPGPYPPTYAHAPQSDVETDLREALRQAGRTIPRYLFRVWRPSSGGDHRLNTIEAITPRAFLNAPDPPHDIFAMETNRLHALIYQHLCFSATNTVFSSWSYSPSIALGLPGRDEGAHISMIDTQQLPINNYVFHSGDLAIGQAALPMVGGEFLVFGVVKGRAYRAVSLNSIQVTCTVRLSALAWMGMSNYGTGPGTIVDQHDRDRLRQAKEIARQFGAEFALPMAIHLLCLSGVRCESPQLLEALTTEFEAPASWARDTSFPSLEAGQGAFPESDAAAAAMLAIAKKLQADGRIQPIKSKKKVHFAGATEEESSDEAAGPAADDVEERRKQKEQSGAVESQQLKKDKRILRAVNELYIAMSGCEAHNDSLQLGRSS